ncbi:MAG TPA: hypothetical protein ENJ68_04735 [Devosia sp.]|nr:hypothetical protein [Devosia sp.]
MFTSEYPPAAADCRNSEADKEEAAKRQGPGTSKDGACIVQQFFVMRQFANGHLVSNPDRGVRHDSVLDASLSHYH